MADEKPHADVAEQQRPALRDDLEAAVQALRDDFDHDTADPAVTAITETPEADPADVADQHRVTPLPDEEEPWP